MGLIFPISRQNAYSREHWLSLCFSEKSAILLPSVFAYTVPFACLRFLKGLLILVILVGAQILLPRGCPGPSDLTWFPIPVYFEVLFYFLHDAYDCLKLLHYIFQVT